MEDQSTSEAQQEVIQPEDCSSTAPQSHKSEQQHDPSPSSATPSSSSSAVTDSSSSPASEDVGAEEDSGVSVAASHRDAAPEPQLPMDTAQPGNVEAQPPQTDTDPGVVMERTGDSVDTGQEPVPHTKQEDTGEVEEALKLEGGEDQVPLEQEASEKTPELELEENGNGVESLDFMNVSILDDMAKRIQVEEVGDRFSVNLVQKLRISLISNQISFRSATENYCLQL